ncbi:hypothetical protein STENM327S_01894 [Streptomyces tendae]
MPAGLELDRAADPLDREARRDGHPERARRDRAGDLRQGTAGRVRALGRRDAVDLRGDGADAAVRDTEFPSRRARSRSRGRQPRPVAC